MTSGEHPTGATEASGATLEELRAVDLFDDLSDDELAEWVALASVRQLEPGAVIAEQAEHPPGLQLLLEGDAQTLMFENGRPEPVGRQHAPTWMGAIAVITGAPLGVRMQAETRCRVALIASADFRRLAFAQPSVHRRVMQQVAPVMTRITAIEQNRERLASLGTMAAGLAHELGNPASAATRAAAQMTEALEVIGSALESFVAAGVSARGGGAAGRPAPPGGAARRRVQRARHARRRGCRGRPA